VPEAIPEIATATKKTSGKTSANATEDRAVA
jgi:hypothetical protein